MSRHCGILICELDPADGLCCLTSSEVKVQPFKFKLLTFEAHVTRIEPDKSRVSHVAGELLGKGFWVGSGERKHLFVLGQRGKDPAGQTAEAMCEFQPFV